MRRTDKQFKEELLRREEKYRAFQRKRRERAVSGLLCLTLILCGSFLVLPFLGGVGGSTESVAPEMWMENGSISDAAEAPAAAEGAAEYGVAGSSAEPQDICPAVMIDGVLYFDTGDINEEPRKCGTFDGEIISQTDGVPTENGQSNFGVGYGYQYGATEGTVEVYINGNWCIFAAEE